jgi:hypothetical protein
MLWALFALGVLVTILAGDTPNPFEDRDDEP